MRVGFIGAGRMGRPMVARLVAAGHDVRAFGRNAESRRDLEQLGAGVAHDVAKAAAQADVVVLCVFSDEQVRQVCLDSALLPAIPSGAALVPENRATLPPAAFRSASRACSRVSWGRSASHGIPNSEPWGLSGRH